MSKIVFCRQHSILKREFLCDCENCLTLNFENCLRVENIPDMNIDIYSGLITDTQTTSTMISLSTCREGHLNPK